MTYHDPLFWILTSLLLAVLLLTRVVWRVIKFRRVRAIAPVTNLRHQPTSSPTTRPLTKAALQPITPKPTMRDIYFQHQSAADTTVHIVKKKINIRRALKHLWRAHVAMATIVVLVIVTTVVVAHASKNTNNVPDATPVVAAQWYNPAWPQRLAVTVKHSFVEEDVTDFPLLVKIQGGHPELFADSATGRDLIFTAGDGVTKLPYEVESYHADKQELVAWVKVPKLSTQTDTVLYVYYGNRQAGNQTEAQAVWTNGYTGVYNINDSANPVPVANSVKAPNDPQYRATYGTATLTSGKIGGALTINTAGAVVDLQATQVGEGANVVPPMTISAWINPQSKAGTIVGKRDLLTTQWQFFTTDNGILNLKEDNNGRWPGHQSYGTQATSVTTGDWQYVVVTVDATGTPTFYNNGTSEVGSYRNGTFHQYPIDGAIGARWLNYPATDYSLVGGIDTVHISNMARSAGWIKTEYANQAYNSAFLTISDQAEKR